MLSIKVLSSSELYTCSQTEVGSIVLSSVVVTSTQTVNIPAVLNITTKQV